MTPNERLDELADELEEAFEDHELEFELSRFRGELTLNVPAEQLLKAAYLLRDHKALQFDICIDVCGVDYSSYGKTEWATKSASATGFGRGREVSDGPGEYDPEKRFASVYHLLSVSKNHRLRVKVFLPEASPIVDSVIDVWRGVDWFEREAFDLFGIMYRGHPDLRRILTDYGFIGHPFRKDFPLSGHVEMRYDAEQQRVVYEPINLEPRTLVPRVIRSDSRYETGESAPVDTEQQTDS